MKLSPRCWKHPGTCPNLNERLGMLTLSLPVAPHKRCRKCDLTKPASEFACDRGRPDGLFAWCRDCNKVRCRQWKKSNPEKLRVAKQAYNATHKAENREYVRRRYAENPERVLAWNKAWRDRNVEQCRERNAKKYVANRDRVLAQQKVYREQNRSTILARCKERYHANRDHFLAAMAEYRRRNLDAVRERNRDYRQRNLAGIRAKQREYGKRPEVQARRKAAGYEQDPEYQRAYYEKYKDEIKAYAVEWSKAHPEVKRASCQRRRARKKSNGPIEKFNDIEIFERDRWTCQICHEPVDKALKRPNPKSPSLDHVIPLSKGGTHARANVQLAHLDCNVNKNDEIVTLF